MALAEIESMSVNPTHHSMATPHGRITLADRRLIFTRNGIREERWLASDEERSAALKEYFEIVV